MAPSAIPSARKVRGAGVSAPGAAPGGVARRVEACAEVIRRHDERLRAFITPTIERARAAAHQADEAAEADAPGPLHGMVVALKDNIDMAGVRCTAGSAFFADHVPDRDAPVVARLRRAGAILIGKTNLHEFAYGGTTQNEHYGRCCNPWDETRLPGGSSGGSAVAVAAGMCEAALGTDTGGSVRMPAALTGVCGLRPTAGAVPNRGSFPVSPPHDTIGPMARRIVDLARVYAVVAGPDPDDPTSAPEAPPDVLASLDAGIEGVRILVPGGWIVAAADPEIASAVQAATGVLGRCGAVIEEAELPGVEAAQAHLMPIIYADAAACHRERLERAPERFGRDVLNRLQPGLELRAIDYAASLRWLEGWRRKVDELFTMRCDAVLTPTAPCAAPKIGTDQDVIATTARLTRFTWPWPAARVPALSVPCGFDRDGLPIGMQIAGARWSEPLLLRLGNAYQAATDWHRRWPPLDDRGATQSPRARTT